jgi:hypothetical protein
VCCPHLVQSAIEIASFWQLARLPSDETSP